MNERLSEQKVQGTKVPHRYYSFFGMKGFGHEKSRYKLVYKTSHKLVKLKSSQLSDWSTHGCCRQLQYLAVMFL